MNKKLLHKLLSTVLTVALSIMCLGLSACGAETVDTVLSVAAEIAEEVVSESVSESESPKTEGGKVEEASADADETEVAAENQAPEASDESAETEGFVENEIQIDEDGWYDSKEEVALYIYTYGRLPDNYITKKEAQALGWSGGGLDSYAPGKSIGGSHFGNYEGILPDGHDYTECDIDTAHASSRGAKRIVFSDDGLIYYTDDHYESFELLYGEE